MREEPKNRESGIERAVREKPKGREGGTEEPQERSLQVVREE